MPDRPAPMDAERFAALADRHGSRLQRWPEAERAAALAFASTSEGEAILAAAARLDTMLDRYAVPPPTADLHARVVAAGTASLAPRRRVRRWWLGLGLAGAGLAGALAGTLAITLLDTPGRTEHLGLGATVTAFGDAGPDTEISEEGS
ncbi:hypothetical protein C5L14_06385 [Labrys okinawensis]|uniref:Anti-sigma factor n=1 Tax=Labrys okinawensis TaxID=346911 RepID=A0A2S9QHL0_9HYPH|nr:hypothetical protein [Labrys okinawensis]PRH88839.1 hypothetical protein C5L14_06385 [Labrys okinawensis]